MTGHRSFCESPSYSRAGVLGFIHTTQIANSVPFYRCYNPRNGDHLTTSDPHCEGYPNHDGRLGYALPGQLGQLTLDDLTNLTP